MKKSGRDVLDIHMRLRGIPYSASAKDVQQFFRPEVDIPLKDVHVGVGIHGRPSGEAFVTFHSHDQVTQAMSKNFRNMGHRYVELVPSSLGELEKARKTARMSSVGKGQGIVRVHRLPHTTTEDDIITFFDGLQIIPNGINIVYGKDGRTIADAYVEFSSEKEAKEALHRNREWNNGTRYVEVFQSSKGELLHVLNYDVSTVFGNVVSHFGLAPPICTYPLPPCVSVANLRSFYRQMNMTALSKDGFSPEDEGGDVSTSPVVLISGFQGQSVTEADIKEWFEYSGEGGLEGVSPPKAIFLMYHAKTHVPKGEAYCIFRSPEEALVATDLNQTHLCEKVVSVRMSNFKMMAEAVRQSTSTLVPAQSKMQKQAEAGIWEPVVPRLLGTPARTAVPGSSYPPPASALPMTQLDIVCSMGSLVPKHKSATAGEDMSYGYNSTTPTKSRPQASSSYSYHSGSSSSSSKRRNSLSGYNEQQNKRARDATSSGGATLRMRGVPYKATKDHILEFFRNYDIIGDSVRFGSAEDGRANGECWVSFRSQSEARKALVERNRKYICERYIELFLA